MDSDRSFAETGSITGRPFSKTSISFFENGASPCDWTRFYQLTHFYQFLLLTLTLTLNPTLTLTLTSNPNNLPNSYPYPYPNLYPYPLTLALTPTDCGTDKMVSFYGAHFPLCALCFVLKHKTNCHRHILLRCLVLLCFLSEGLCSEGDVRWFCLRHPPRTIYAIHVIVPQIRGFRLSTNTSSKTAITTWTIIIVITIW